MPEPTLTVTDLRERVGKTIWYRSENWPYGRWRPVLLRDVSQGGWVKATFLDSNTSLNVHPKWWGNQFADTPPTEATR